MPVGTVTICVDTSALDPKRRQAYAYAPPPGKGKDPPGGGPSSPGAYVAIPVKYADRATTDLTCAVTGGRQTFDIKMK